MIRLWHRVGTFRALSVLVLLAGLVGGLVIADRQTQHKTATPLNAADAVALDTNTSPTMTAAPPAGAQAQAQTKAQDAASAAAAQAKAAEDELRRKQEEASRSQTRSASPTTSKAPTTKYPVPASCSSYTGHKATGCAVLLASGYGLDQMPCLEKLWDKESHWNPLAYNKSSGAGGIPQALPASKMGANWRNDPTGQIKWGIGYIKGRYKTPCNAWSHSQSTGWY